MSRITEKKIYRVAPVPFTSDGTNTGMLTVADSSIFMVGQIVILRSSTQPNLSIKIKRILPDQTTIFLGPEKKHISLRTDISAYTVADGATIEANEQERPTVPEQEIERHTYEEEPTVARRTILVDKWGCRVDESNPLPVSATVTTSNAGTPSIFNVTALTAGQEYSQVLPNNTSQFFIRARNNAKLQISYAPGQTGTLFLTVTPGTIYEVDSVKLTGKTIYFQSTKDDTEVEIVTWV